MSELRSYVTKPLRVGAAVDPEDAAQLQQVAGGGTTTAQYLHGFIQVTDITAPVELNAYNGKNYGVITAYQRAGAGSVGLYANYYFDGASQINGNGRTRVTALADADYTNPLWIAGGSYNLLGEITQEGNHVPLTDDTYDLGRTAGGNLYWHNLYVRTVRLRQNAVNALDAVPKQMLDGIIQTVAVASIANPASEMASLTGSNGSFLIAYQSTGGTSDDATLYSFDASAGSANVPYVVAGTGGKWIARGGRYMYSGVFVSGGLTSLGTVAGNALTATTAITGADLSISNTSSVGGIQTLTAQPCAQASFTGSATITTGTNTTVTWTENIDRGSNMSSGTFTVPTGGGGPYWIAAQMSMDVTVENQQGNILIIKNGVTTIGTFPCVTGLTNAYASGGLYVTLIAGDTVIEKVRQDTGVNATLTYAVFNIAKFG